MRASPVLCAVSLVVAAGLGVAPSAPAAAKPKLPSRTVQCGEVVTESLRVANNLEDCPEDGLIIGAPNITVDLGGHRIDGTQGAIRIGIQNAGHAGVEIRNGIVDDFGWGVAILDAPGNTLTLLRVIRSGSSGISLGSSPNTVVQDNAVSGNLDGIVLSESDGSIVAGNDASGNARRGFVVEFASQNVFIGNTAVANGTYGIENFGSSGNTYKDNTTRGNGIDGIRLPGRRHRRRRRPRHPGAGGRDELGKQSLRERRPQRVRGGRPRLPRALAVRSRFPGSGDPAHARPGISEGSRSP